jgi:predicted RNA-binding protein YlxR (DUF448 family)
MRRAQHVPQRSCAACRQVRTKAELIRIVRTPLGEVCLDLTGKMAGRGAYLCRDVECLNAALKQKKLGRALGVSVNPEIEVEVRQVLDEAPAGRASSQEGDR